MARRTINLSEKTYDRLQRVKGEDESLGDVIDRLLETHEEAHPLYALVGLDAAMDLKAPRARSRAFRKDLANRMRRDP